MINSSATVLEWNIVPQLFMQNSKLAWKSSAILYFQSNKKCLCKKLRHVEQSVFASNILQKNFTGHKQFAYPWASYKIHFADFWGRKSPRILTSWPLDADLYVVWCQKGRRWPLLFLSRYHLSQPLIKALLIKAKTWC